MPILQDLKRHVLKYLLDVDRLERLVQHEEMYASASVMTLNEVLSCTFLGIWDTSLPVLQSECPVAIHSGLSITDTLHSTAIDLLIEAYQQASSDVSNIILSHLLAFKDLAQTHIRNQQQTDETYALWWSNWHKIDSLLTTE